MSCYGKQETLAMMREKKSKIYQKYKNNQKAPEYQENFFKYIPKIKNGNQPSESSEKTASPKHYSLSMTMKTVKTPKHKKIEVKGEDEEKATTQSIEDTFKSSPNEKNVKEHSLNKPFIKKHLPYKNKTKKLFSFSKLGKFLWK